MSIQLVFDPLPRTTPCCSQRTQKLAFPRSYINNSCHWNRMAIPFLPRILLKISNQPLNRSLRASLEIVKSWGCFPLAFFKKHPLRIWARSLLHSYPSEHLPSFLGRPVMVAHVSRLGSSGCKDLRTQLLLNQVKPTQTMLRMSSKLDHLPKGKKVKE